MNPIERQKEIVDKLFQLIKERAELPIVPMVYSEIVADDCCCRWMGSWGCAEIDKYLITDERVYFHSEENEELVEKFVLHDEYISMSDEELKQAYENLPWIEAIIVNIDLTEL